jgi:hypothetical protein
MIQKGFVQALGVVGYCSLVGFVIWKGNQIFDNNPGYTGPLTFLMLFSVSALMCALIVFYRPYILFFENKKKEALDLVVFTAGWLFLFLVILISFTALI